MKVLAVNLMFVASANDAICPADYPLAGDDPTGAHQTGKGIYNKWLEKRYNTYCCKKIKDNGHCDFDYEYEFCDKEMTLHNKEISSCDDHRDCKSSLDYRQCNLTMALKWGRMR